MSSALKMAKKFESKDRRKKENMINAFDAVYVSFQFSMM
jgi:hypothetical protein